MVKLYYHDENGKMQEKKMLDLTKEEQKTLGEIIEFLLEINTESWDEEDILERMLELPVSCLESILNKMHEAGYFDYRKHDVITGLPYER